MAIRDFIKIDKTAPVASPKAGDLIAFKDAVARVLMLGPPLLDIMGHNFDDKDALNIIWTDMESLFGIPEGKGQQVFDMINGAMGAISGKMQNDQAKNLVARVG